MSRYLSEILLVQIVATYLVVLGHSYPFTVDVPDWLKQTQIFIYTFHMPLFVWISGYLLIYTRQIEKSNFKTFTKKRFVKLLVPYFVLSSIAILPKYAVQPYLNDTFTLDAYSIAKSFFAPRENIWGHFWFLPMIFIQGACGFVVDKVFSKMKAEKIGWSCVTLITFAIYAALYRRDISQWLSINDLILFSWIFCAGCLCGCSQMIDKLSKHKSVLSVIFAASGSILLFFMTVPQCFASIKSALIALMMIYALVEICIIIAPFLNVNKHASYAQTFTIFLLSWPCQAVINVATERLLQWPFYLIMTLQFMTGIIGPLILIYIIKKIEFTYNIHWISYILGK